MKITQKQLEEIVTSLREKGRAQFMMWTFMFTPKGGGLMPMPCNLFSAKVHGSTVEDDWGNMGAVCAAIGIPAICEWPKTIETDANATHYWRW